MYAGGVLVEDSSKSRRVRRRGDSRKRTQSKRSAKIAYELSGVSIANEDDWKRMASFRSEWSKKLYDEIVPIVLSALQ